MARHIHVHVHETRDSKWEESKHPRKDDGKFGTGKGDAKGDEGNHKHVLGRIDSHYDRHTAELNKHGGHNTPKGGAHADAAEAFGKARAALNMNQPIGGQERFNALMDKALDLGAKADAMKAGKGGSEHKAPEHSVGKRYTATSEPSQFGGHRPVIKEGDRVTHLSHHSFETAEQAAEYARRYAMVPDLVGKGVGKAPDPKGVTGYIEPMKGK